jgi:hypothetical protein
MLALSLTARAHAQQRALPFTFTACSTLPEDEVRRIAAIELGRAPADDATVEVLCGAQAIEVRARQGVRSLSKTMSTTGVDERSSARLVALSAAELLLELERLSRAELEPPRARPLPAPPARRDRFRVLPALAAYAPFRGSLLALGPHVALEARPRAYLGVQLGLEAVQGERDISGGTLRLRALHGFVGVRGLYGAHTGSPLRAFASLSLLAGAHELRGEPGAASLRTGDSFRASTLGARLGLGGELLFAKRGVASLELDLTRYSRTLRARNEGKPHTVVGPWGAHLLAGVGVLW